MLYLDFVRGLNLSCGSNFLILETSKTSASRKERQCHAKRGLIRAKLGELKQCDNWKSFLPTANANQVNERVSKVEYGTIPA
jgi:hypothetical protein